VHLQINDDDEGNVVQTFDSEGVAYFLRALMLLEKAEPGSQITIPSVYVNGKGEPLAVQGFIMRKVADE